MYFLMTPLDTAYTLNEGRTVLAADWEDEMLTLQ